MTKKLYLLFSIPLLLFGIQACTVPEIGLPDAPEFLTQIKIELFSKSFFVLEELNGQMTPSDSIIFATDNENIVMVIERESSSFLEIFGEIEANQDPTISQIGNFEITIESSSNTIIGFIEANIISDSLQDFVNTNFPTPQQQDTLRFSTLGIIGESYDFESNPVENEFEEFNKIVIVESSKDDTIRLKNNFSNPILIDELVFWTTDFLGNQFVAFKESNINQTVQPGNTLDLLHQFKNQTLWKKYSIAVSGTYFVQNDSTYGQELNRFVNIEFKLNNDYTSSEVDSAFVNGQENLKIDPISDSIAIYEANAPFDPENPNANAMIIECAFFDTLIIPLKIEIDENLKKLLSDTAFVIHFDELFIRPQGLNSKLEICSTDLIDKFEKPILKSDLGKKIDLIIEKAIMRFETPPAFGKGTDQSMRVNIDYKLSIPDTQFVSIKFTNEVKVTLEGPIIAIYAAESFLEGKVSDFIDSTIVSQRITYPEDIKDKGFEFQTANLGIQIVIPNTRMYGFADLIARGIKNLPDGSKDTTVTKSTSKSRIFITPHPSQNKSISNSNIENWADLAALISKYPENLEFVANMHIGNNSSGDDFILDGESLVTEAKIRLELPMILRLNNSIFFNEVNLNDQSSFSEFDVNESSVEFINDQLQDIRLSIELQNDLPFRLNFYIFMDTSKQSLVNNFNRIKDLVTINIASGDSTEFIALSDSLNRINFMKSITSIFPSTLIRDTLKINGFDIQNSSSYKSYYYPPFTDSNNETKKIYFAALPELINYTTAFSSVPKDAILRAKIDLLFDLAIDRRIDNH